MISKISFSKLVRDEMRKLNWLLAVQILVFGLLIPFRVLMELAMQRPKFFAGQTHIRDIFYSSIGLGHLENTIFILMAGVICAISAFSYVHSSQKLDFFHSLPIKRERLFAAKYLGSVLTFVFAYALSQTAALLIGAVYGVCSARVIFEMALATVEGILCFLCSYAGALLAVMLTGKMLSTFLAIGVMGCYFPLVWLLWVGVEEIFYHTALSGDTVMQNGTAFLTCTSPWAFAVFRKSPAVMGVTGPIPGPAALCQLIAVAAVFSFVSLTLYRARKTEAAGNALAFRKVEGVVKVLLMIPTAILAAIIAYAGFYSPVWELFFIVFFGALGCMIIEFIYRGDIRQVLSHKSHILVTVAVSSIVFFACRYDVTGFNTYLPAYDEVEAMAVHNYEMFGIRDQGYTQRGLLDSLEVEHFDPIYEMAQSGAGGERMADWDSDSVNIRVKYRLKNGKSVYRRYWVSRGLYNEKMNELQKDADFREKYYDILSWENTDDISHMQFSVMTGDLSALGFSDTSYDENSWSDADAADEISEESSGEAQTDAETADSEAETDAEIADSGIIDGEEDYYGEPVEETAATEALSIHISGENMDRVIAAYCEDLAEVSYTDLQNYEMSFTVFKKDKTSEVYYVSQSCENTLNVIREIFSGKTVEED